MQNLFTYRKLFIFLAVALSLSACRSTPKYENISAKYLRCDPKQMKPVEVTNHGWYKSWYVDCGGQEFYCRHSDNNENGWNGCYLSQTD